ncbi:MAG TPA: hypothetical protein VN924_12305 [Bryobacteraceae bacterium]|nr:hypothetical protein [Bryobacteraceae bacterium]
MNWWQQPFVQEALPIMIAIVIGAWYQCRKIGEWIDELSQTH